MRTTLLLDADIIAYKHASSTEHVVYFDGEDSEPAVSSDFDKATCEVARDIDALREQLHADHVIVCLSDPDVNFRKGIWPGYKANRVNVRKPVDLMNIKQWLKEEYESYQRPALEADDCMGILSTHPTLIKGEKIIVSEDKDMQTIPGWLYNPRRDIRPRKISQLEADRYHLYQTIIGDSCDGYPGAYRVGPKSPYVAGVMSSKTVEEAWGHVLGAFAKALKTELDDPEVEKEALLQARLARILRADDWDFSAKLPKLWSPPAIST